jgi:hypothetical protein
MKTNQLAVSFESTPVRELYLDESDRTPAEGIIEAVAELDQADPRNLPPLHESVDTDVLNQMIRTHRSRPESTVAMCFTYAGWNVFARANGSIVIGDPERRTEPVSLF